MWSSFSYGLDCRKRYAQNYLSHIPSKAFEPVDYSDVGFVIVTKNSDKTLKATIDNIQSLYPRVEIIIVDGGSYDNTVNIAKTLGCHVFEGDWNVGAARNLSLTLSSKRYLAHVDSDVILSAGWLQLVKPYFAAHDVAAVSGVTIYGYRSDQALASYCLESGLIGTAAFTNTLLDREKVIKAGGIAAVQWGEDWEAYVKILKNGYRWELASEAFVYHRRYFWQQLRAFYSWAIWWRRTSVTSTREIVRQLIVSPPIALLLGLKLHPRLVFYHPLLRLAALVGWLRG